MNEKMLEQSVHVVRVLNANGDVRSDVVHCTTEEDLCTATEDFFADAHRELIPGFEYEGFTKEEILYTEGTPGSGVVGTHKCTRIDCTIVVLEG
jgi:hypothetical protein